MQRYSNKLIQIFKKENAKKIKQMNSNTTMMFHTKKNQIVNTMKQMHANPERKLQKHSNKQSRIQKQDFEED